MKKWYLRSETGQYVTHQYRFGAGLNKPTLTDNKDEAVVWPTMGDALKYVALCESIFKVRFHVTE